MRIIFLFILSGLFTVAHAQQNNSQKPVTIKSIVKKSYNGADVSCTGVRDAELTVIASGGSGKYEYSKNNFRTYQVSNILTELEVDANTIVRVRDADNYKNFSEAGYVWIANVQPVVVNRFERETYYNNGGDGVSCAGRSDGAISLGAHGGREPYTYSIDAGKTFQSGNSFKNLSAGTYSGIVKDANGCLGYSSVKVILVEPNPIVVKVLSFQNINCANPLGSITVEGEGSKGDYEFSLDGRDFFYVKRGKSHTFKNLQPGKHQIIIKENQHGCPGIHNFEITNTTATLSAASQICEKEEHNLLININGTPPGKVVEKFTATYTDDQKNVYTKTDLHFGGNVFSIGRLERSATFKLISVVSSTGCTVRVSDEENNVTLNPAGTWLGFTRDWHDLKNWPCGQLPEYTTNVYIGPTANDPVIDGEAAKVNNLAIGNGASLTVISHLLIAGNIKIETGKFDVTEGKLEFCGRSMQEISGSMLKNKTIHNLVISNDEGVEVNSTLGDTLNITGNLIFGTKTAILYTGDNITMKSTIMGTANIGFVHEGNIIKGKFIVERYINTGTDKTFRQHGKAWIMLATPTTGSTIFESWQEGGKSTGKTPIEDTHRGYGTLLTTSYNNVPGNGFDLYTGAGSSIKTFLSAENRFDGGPTSTDQPLYNENGYMMMVRGDRSVYTSSAQAVPVTLRSKGDIITGTTKQINIRANSRASVGNPYAARIYLNKIQMTGVDNYIFVWDPKLGSSYGLGAFQTLYNNGENYYAIPGGGSFAKGPVTFIESGEAFFVQTTKTEGSIYFTEDAKLPSSKSMFQRAGNTTNNNSSLRTTLFALGTGEAVMVDGNLLLTGDSFNNDIDGADARKMTNSSENFSILSAGNSFVLESRQTITNNDTIMYTMTGMRAQTYKLEIEAENIFKPGMQAWLEDSFLQTKTPLNLEGKTVIEFSVSSLPGAAAANRFMIVFRPAKVLPVTFTEVKATKNSVNILVEWKVESESNLKQYEVEKSIDGNSFIRAGVVLADKTNGGNYKWIDETMVSGYTYYRVRSVDLDSKTSLTQIVKIKTDIINASMSVYPNPVSKGVINLHLGNQAAGIYHLRLVNPVGQTLLNQSINHKGGNYTEQISWDHSLPKGLYNLEVSNLQTGVKVIAIMN